MGTGAHPPASPERAHARDGGQEPQNMGSLRCPVEFFLRYGLSKRAEASFC